MRLLNAETLELHSFQDSDTPGYAILSHTWHDEEVLFEDLRDMSQASKKSGYFKISFCCKQALEDGIQYVWIDTCCIDKTSSTELSEAINSMYRWYQCSEICYAYLRDVLLPIDASNNISISCSRWFERSWTLQELLAPRSLVFYSSEWTKIGTKDTLGDIISNATGIKEEYLSGGDFRMASVACRMSWASDRKATRAEDIAYSLFGIFNVHMPLLYGEGQQKAFMRLQEEIMKYSDDHTLFVWENDPMKDCQNQFSRAVLAPSPAHFGNSHDLVPIFKTSSEAPYSMTNIGLQICLPLKHDIDREPSEERGHEEIIPKIVIAALNCRQENDFFHVLGLPLVSVETNHFFRHPTRNLEIIPVGALPSFNMREIIIQDQRYKVPEVRTNRRLAFVIRKLPASCRIGEAYPDQYWSVEDRIIQGFKKEGYQKSWHACLRLKVVKGDYRRYFLLTLGVDALSAEPRNLYTASRKTTPWVEYDCIFKPWGNLVDYPWVDGGLEELHGQQLPSLCSKFRDSGEHQGVRVAFNEGCGDSDRVGFVNVFDEYMCVVDITVSVPDSLTRLSG